MSISWHKWDHRLGSTLNIDVIHCSRNVILHDTLSTFSLHKQYASGQVGEFHKDKLVTHQSKYKSWMHIQRV